MHASTIPAEAEQVVDRQDGLWSRASSATWTGPDGEEKHERWLLGILGPVHCPVEFNIGQSQILSTDPRVSVKP